MKTVACVVGTLICHLVASTGVAAHIAPAPVQYRVKTRVPLHRDLDGIDGSVELLIDERITSEIEAAPYEVDRDEELQKKFAVDPLRLAQLRTLDSLERVVETRTLKQPVAALEAVSLYGTSRRSFLVTEDYSSGFGSYSGPATQVMEMTGGRWRVVQAKDAATGKLEALSVAKTGKTAWKLAPYGEATDILEVICLPDLAHPTGDSMLFVTRVSTLPFQRDAMD